MDHEFYDLFDNFSITKHQITAATNHLLSEKVQKRKKVWFSKTTLMPTSKE